jgi:hypothetical protein
MNAVHRLCALSLFGICDRVCRVCARKDKREGRYYGEVFRQKARLVQRFTPYASFAACRVK